MTTNFPRPSCNNKIAYLNVSSSHDLKKKISSLCVTTDDRLVTLTVGKFGRGTVVV